MNQKINEIVEHILVFVVMSIVIGLISWRWVVGIDYMMKNHPDYKGEDLFGEFDEDDKNQIGNG